MMKYSTLGIDAAFYILDNDTKDTLFSPVFSNRASAKAYADKLNLNQDFRVVFVLKSNRTELGFEDVTAKDDAEAIERGKEKFISAWGGKKADAKDIVDNSLAFLPKRRK